jgi:hypothetical protein
MIEQFVSCIAARMGIDLSRITLVDGQPLGCIDVQLLNMSSKGHVVSALVFQADIENLKNGTDCDSLEVRMRSSLSRLQVLLDSR